MRLQEILSLELNPFHYQQERIQVRNQRNNINLISESISKIGPNKKTLEPDVISSQSVAVLEFEGKNVSVAEASALTDRLRNELFQMGQFKIIERGQMDEILNEQAFQQTGCVSSECAVEVGKMLGVPVHKILGGGSHVDSVRAYLTSGPRDKLDKASCREYADYIKSSPQGWTGVKVTISSRVNSGGRMSRRFVKKDLDLTVKGFENVRQALGDDIEIVVVEVRGEKVRLGIKAPTEIAVHRGELRERAKMEVEIKPEAQSEAKTPPVRSAKAG